MGGRGRTAAGKRQAGQRAVNTIEQFNTKSDRDRAFAIATAKSYDVGDMPDTVYQKFIMSQGLDEPPIVRGGDDFDNTDGIEVYRVVNGDTVEDVEKIVASTMYDKNTWYSGDNSSVYGRGIYTADSVGGALQYAEPKRVSAIMRFKIPTGTKIMNRSEAMENLFKTAASGTMVGNQINRLDATDALSITALLSGAKVVTAMYENGYGAGYYPLLTRSGIVMDNEYKIVDYSQKRGGTYLKWKDLI